MSLEEQLSALTKAIESLTKAIEAKQAAPSKSAEVISLPVMETAPATLDGATTEAAKSREVIPEAAEPKKRGRPRKSPETTPTRVTFDDAVKVLVEMTKEQRLEVLEHFKPGAQRLKDVAALGDDIWERVIAKAEELKGGEDDLDDE